MLFPIIFRHRFSLSCVQFLFVSFVCCICLLLLYLYCTCANEVALYVVQLHKINANARTDNHNKCDGELKLERYTVCFRAKSLSLPRGTICYLAPEVLRTIRPIAYRTMAAVYAFNAQTDVFAFG